MFLKNLIVMGTIFSLFGFSGENGVLFAHHHNHKPNKDYNVVEATDIKYESFDASGKKVSSGTLKFKTKYLDTSEGRYS